MKSNRMVAASGWLVAFGLAVATLWQWRAAGHARERLAQCMEEADESPAEPAIRPQPPDMEKTGTRQLSEEKSRTRPDAAACLAIPAVRGEIERRAAELATGISETRIEEYKREEAARRLQRRSRFVDGFEEASAAAIDAYARDRNLDESRTARLHQIFDENIRRQREIFARIQSGEIDEATARQQGQALREEARRQVEALLGEENAQGLMRAIGEEMRARFERDRQNAPPGE